MTQQEAAPQVKPVKFRSVHPVAFLVTFGVLLVIWAILSGRFDRFHLTLGVVSCGIVSFISSDLLFGSGNFDGVAGKWIRFIGYIPWLMSQIVICNFQVLALVFSPRLHERINPQIVRFRSGLKSDMAILTFANSITLTPGTITIQATVFGDFAVHALYDASAKGLPGEMEARIQHVFRE